MNQEDFKDIAPYADEEFHGNLQQLVKEPGFEHAVTYIMPEVDYPQFVEALLKVENCNEFQTKVMAPFLEMLARKTTASLTMSGTENIKDGTVYTFISNHRDIVLDASFLNVCLIQNGFATCEVALGDNLLIYEWIEKLVKINKGFIVRRNLKLLEAFKAAKQLSGYIRYCITQKHESVWIAQREGRAKDSDDRTQESVMKMLALSGDGNPVDALKALNICPVTISYELDPNDYLKAAEFLRRRRDPDFKKTSYDDLHSMEIGLIGYKGNVHFTVSPCINPMLDDLVGETDKNVLFDRICRSFDRNIHLGYEIFPVNYISYDRVNATDRFADKYTKEDVEKFDAYIDRQLAKVKVEDITPEEYAFMRETVLKMYANPLINKLNAENR